MSVSRRRVLAVILIVFTGTAAFLGYNAYKAFFGGIDSDYKLQISKEIEDINREIGEGLLQPDGSANPDGDDGSAGEPADPPPAPPADPPPAPPATPAPDLARIDSVKGAYESGIRKLQDQGNSVVNGLIADAKGEYAALRKAGGGKSAVLNLAVSYMGKATAMEKEIDAGFNALLSGMSTELAAAGMPQAEIDGYVSGLREAYRVEKETRRNALMDRAKEYL
ncbi:MAG TPA: hypothetical protein GX688_06905 [Clostridiales bacterium]|nr:hypothetical protein [Clostridiales bacterium]